MSRHWPWLLQLRGQVGTAAAPSERDAQRHEETLALAPQHLARSQVRVTVGLGARVRLTLSLALAPRHTSPTALLHVLKPLPYSDGSPLQSGSSPDRCIATIVAATWWGLRLE